MYDAERERMEKMLALKDAIQEIIPNLYLTSRFGAKNKQKLDDSKISHIGLISKFSYFSFLFL